jgi:putative membrane protein
MMCGFHDAGGWWVWLVMAPLMVAFWGFVIWAVVALVRAAGSGSTAAGTAGPGPEQILSERYARGEIDAAEYERRLATLRGDKSTA